MHERENAGRLTAGNKVRRALWNLCYLLFFRPFGTKLFRMWRILILRCFGGKVNSSADVYASAKIWAPWNLRMESNSCIGPHAICYNQAMVEMGKDACVSQFAFICTAGHELDEIVNPSDGLVVAPINIGDNAWIGARAFIGMGVEIGEGAVVGASASVFKDVEPWTVVAGNPAREIKKRVMRK